MPASPSNAAALAAAVRAYDRADPATRVHVRLRRWLSCLERIEPLLPAAGPILEVGCGHGLFSRFLAEASPHRQVLGIDIDDRKIAAGNAVPDRTGRVRLAEGDALSPPAALTPDAPPGFAGVVFVDVLYLLDEELQRRALAAARAVLRPGGCMVLKTQECHPAWKYQICRAQEWLATRGGLTAGASLTFPAREPMRQLLRSAGYSDIETFPVEGRLYPDVIHRCRR